MFRPTSVNIFSQVFSIIYVQDQAKVDIASEKMLWGQINYHDKTIRIYDNGLLGEAEMLGTIFEEVIHAISSNMRFQCFDEEQDHRELSGIATGLADVFIRNGWLKESI